MSRITALMKLNIGCKHSTKALNNKSQKKKKGVQESKLNDVQVVSTLWADINEEDYGEDICLDNMREVPVVMEPSFQKVLSKSK